MLVLDEDMAGFCWFLNWSSFTPEDPVDEEKGWAIREFLEEFGWKRKYEGDMWKLETNGVLSPVRKREVEKALAGLSIYLRDGGIQLC